MTVVTVIFSFWGHKNISFRQRLAGEEGKVQPGTPNS
jgi:hypothetical protein